jgi:hypothetical protein
MYQNTTPVKSLEYRRRLMADGNLPSEKTGDSQHDDRKSDDEKV